MNGEKYYKVRDFIIELTEKDFFDGVHLNNAGLENFSEQLTNFILRGKGISTAKKHKPDQI